MKTRVHNTSASREEMIKGTYTQQTRQFDVSEEAPQDESECSSEETYDGSTSGGINVKSEFAAEECVPDDGLDLYEEQTVESSYSALTDYNILKDLVVQSVKNEGELMIHSEFAIESKTHGVEANETTLVKHEYEEVDPNEYEIEGHMQPMAYEEHEDIETQKVQKFFCLKCPLHFESQKKLKKHKKIHNDKPFSCKICFKKFKKEMGMKVHISLKHGRQESNLMLQFRAELGEYTTSKVLGRKILKIDETRYNGQRYDCKDCRRNFIQLSHLKNHLKSHKQRKSKPYECGMCFKCFAQRGSLYTHEKIHMGHKPFKCHICTRAFFQKGNLLTHLKIHAHNNKNLKGQYKKNKQPKYVKPIATKVIREIPPSQSDSNIKKFTCLVCSKSFLQLTNLHTHMRTHTGNRPFSCSYCSKSFTQIGNLQKHLKIHTGERPFKCDVCSKAFVQKCQMQKHMRVHGNDHNSKRGPKQSVPRVKVFQCKNCPKKYKQNVNLQKHMRLHSKDQNEKRARKPSVPRIKVFQCQNCSKNYKQNANLKKHMEKCIGPTQNIPMESNTKQIHFERIPNVKVEEEESVNLSDSSDNASVSGNASSDSSNDSDSSEFGNEDYDSAKNEMEF